MLLKKEGFPEEDELVLCTVTAVQSHSVFCKLDEYEKQGMINISEVAPGRIRNIRDYVVEGKKIVCQVLRVDKEKGYIDLSLRRVSETQRKKKLNEIKQEQLAEKIVEQVAKQRDEPLEVLYKKVRAVLKDWPNLFPAFEKVAKRELSLEKVGFEPELARQLEEVILTRIKPPQKILEGILTLTSYASNGIQLIKETLLAGLIP
ncbi:MAG: S1 RNA-binding domain-containing protein, partial [Candidatus Woesearchaeota archaeon]